MDRDLIERAAYDLRNMVWKRRVDLGIDAGPYIAMLDPALGASVLGFRFDVVEDLGAGIAGLIDRNKRRIAIVRRFSCTTRRFTGAHELGHLVMHKGLVMHRDRPIEGLSERARPRAPEEAEADHFAACYLMPRKLVEDAFAWRFRTRKPFVVNDDAAHLLSPNDPDAFYSGTGLECAAILSAAHRYGHGAPFQSLAEEFRVSVQTMAIRLTEIGLI